jgi:hypothetical protein
MSASFRKIDYSLRPAKHAERRMLCEIFRKLRPFGAVEQYLYVGMGSLWFSDFILFHRLLGIKDMISIDKTGAKARLEANKPFRSITMDFRSTTVALPKLDWTRRHFMWLDYDDQIDPDKLLDVKTVATRAVSGTTLAVSVQCEAAKEVEEARAEEDATAMDRFRSRFGRDRVTADVWEDDLTSWRFGKLSRQLFLSEIEEALAVRNSGNAAEELIEFHPICDIEYSDGAKMTTVVGIFVARKDVAALRACEFDKLDFLESKDRLIHIDVPKLTVREIRRLEQQLPRSEDQWELEGVPAKDAKLFAKLYRYLPNFAVLEH